MGIDYLESLFTGMDIIIDKRLKELSFDKTIVCTVVYNENKKMVNTEFPMERLSLLPTQIVINIKLMIRYW